MMFWITICAIVVFMVDMWSAYLAVMNMKRNIKLISPVAKPFAWLILARGLLLDVLFNLTIGTVSFAELPHEWLFTSRCIRHKRGDGWRKRVALWWCRHFMDGFDPSGVHCA